MCSLCPALRCLHVSVLAQPIANTKFTRTLGTSMCLLSLDMHDNQAANTAILDLLALFLSYRQFLPQLPCCTWWRRKMRERDLSKDTIPYNPALWELRHWDRPFSPCPAVLKGVPDLSWWNGASPWCHPGTGLLSPALQPSLALCCMNLTFLAQRKCHMSVSTGILFS